MKPLFEIQLHTQFDAIASRQRAREIADICGFNKQDQTRLATAVSELARVATHQAKPGRVSFFLSTQSAQERQSHLIVEVLNRAWGARHESEHEPADRIAFDAGLSAARRFTADTRVDEQADVLGIRLSRARPAWAPLIDALDVVDAVAQLSPLSSNVALSEAQRQNRRLEAHNNDVTSLNSELLVRADSLISADRRKDEFLAVLAHELRGPLSALSMAGSALALGAPDAARIAYLGQMITRQASHMSRIVEDLLDVARIVRDEIVIERGSIDLGHVIHAAVEQLEAAASRRRHVVDIELPADPVVVEGDATRLLQVVGNLVGNSIRYTPEGGHITVALLAHTPPGYARMSVTDNGIGISADLLPKLFDLFTQAQRSADSRNSGLGLGLALVKTLVEAHGGSVTASSPGAGRGSCFEVTLPYRSSQAAGPAAP